MRRCRAGAEILERRHELAPDRAAQAAGREGDHLPLDAFDEQMIERDLAELVDEHHGIRERLVLHQGVEQGRLAGPEEAGEDVDRDRFRCAHQRPDLDRAGSSRPRPPSRLEA